MKLLTAGHHGVTLTSEQWERLTTWIDTNGVYYDRYETYYPNRDNTCSDLPWGDTGQVRFVHGSTGSPRTEIM